jgi:hypothetical protein
MDPTTAMYLAKAHARDLEAEAAQARLVKSIREQAANDGRRPNWSIRLRRVIPLLRGKAAGAATA